MTREEAMLHALDAMVRANDGRRVLPANCIDYYAEQAIALDRKREREARRALLECVE